MKYELSRRSFLKLSGASVLTLTAVSIFGGCSGVGTGGSTGSAAYNALPGSTYPVGNYTVQLTGIAGQKMDLTESQQWVNAFKTGYKAIIKDKDFYDAALPSLRKAAEDNGINEANKVVTLAKASLELTIKSASERAILLGDKKADVGAAAKDLVSNSRMVTALCDGKAVPCALGEITVEPGTTTQVPLAIALPVNFKSMTLTVSLGKPVLTYFFENRNYLDTAAYVPES